MLSNYSSNVIISKVRSMYSKHMTQKDYSLLLNCKTVEELTSVLKQRSRGYEDILSDLNEDDVHRSQLESLIRRKKFKDSLSICRYELSVGDQFSKYVIKKTEIYQMLYTLRLILSGKSPTLIYTMPIFFSKYSSIDFPSLTKVKNYDEFLISMGRSDYKKILLDFQNSFESDPISLAKIEVKLYSYLYSHVYNIIDKHVSKGSKKELYDIFDPYIDLHNYVRIFRMKKYYKIPPKNIRDFIIPFGSLTQKQLNSMIEADNHKEIISIVKNTSLGKKIQGVEFSYPDEIPMRVNYKICSRYVRFSRNPSVVMFCYINLLNIEISNIINIIEGIRYKMPSEKIMNFLIFNKV